MVRTGNSFTSEEIREMEYWEKRLPELKDECDVKWWRQRFDEKRKFRLGCEFGLDRKIANGAFRCSETVSALSVRDDCTRIMYAQTKARVFNILESQFDEGTRLEAVKRAVEDVLSAVSDNIDAYLMRSLIVDNVITE